MIYCFICPKCKLGTEVHRPMAESSLPVTCVCGTQMERNYQAEQCATHGDYSEPIISSSMAFDAQDADEHRKRHPGVELQIDGQFAYPVLRSLTQKRAYLKARKWQDNNAFN